MWANDVGGETYIEVYAVLPKDGGKDFAANIVTLGTIESPLLAQVNRTALIIALETYFGRVQIFRRRAGIRQILPERMAEREH